MKYIIPFTTLVVGILIGYFFLNKDYNSTLVYGDTGFPKNCRAIVYENIKEYRNGNYSAEDIIESLDRNCGINGYSWDK